ncbi:MAG TPA: MFS transporter [Propionibacteriaceae bacterium]|nr:MFS transporter [Propionibacteriaceae bacterium]
MIQTAATVRRTYYVLTAGNTLAASLIWGINTIFLLDAGLTNFEAFAANAFYTAGMVLFEIPTGVVADSRGRRTSFLWGTVTLAVATGLYVLLWQLHASFGWWAVVSVLLGLGYTFFSGATEAWLVDALTETKFDGMLEAVFSRGQVVGGVFMLLGSVAGGYLAQLTNLGIPYVARAGILLIMFVLALIMMRDLGFSPDRGTGPVAEIKKIVHNSVTYGLKVSAIRNTMISGVFAGGVGVYVFYALQPHLLDLWGNPEAYGIAGLVAAIISGAMITGGLITPFIRRRFTRRTSALLFLAALGLVPLALIGLLDNFWVVVGLIVLWGLADAAAEPIRRAYLNGMIPSAQRATILSFDSLFSSAGGIVAQPALGRSADLYGYKTSYLISAAASALALPFLFLARRAADPADREIAVPAPEDEPKSPNQVDA